MIEFYISNVLHFTPKSTKSFEIFNDKLTLSILHNDARKFHVI